jgi:multidrug efflux pump subunit AcrA (membrane-fusion protein)
VYAEKMMSNSEINPSGRKQMLRMRAVKGLGMLAVLALLMMWLAGTFRTKIGPAVSTEPISSRKELSAVKVERRTFPLLIDQVGTVRSRTEAQVSTRIMAQVSEIRVKEGDSVVGNDSEHTAPTILAILDDREIQAKLNQTKSQITGLERAISAARSKAEAAEAQTLAAKAGKKLAGSDYSRFERLRAQQAATGQQFDNALAQKDVADARLAAAVRESEAGRRDVDRLIAEKDRAEAALAEAKVILSYTVIQAPFTGRLLKKMVDVGDMTSPGQALFYIETASQPEMHATVSESLVRDIQTGQSLAVSVDSMGEVLVGKVREIAPRADPATRTFPVKLSLPADSRLVNGLFGKIRIPHGTYDTLIVPAAAVRESGQLSLVDWRGPDGRISRRIVRVGERHGALVEILSGLQEGEEVLIP